MVGAEGNFEVSKADIGVLWRVFLFLMPMPISGGNIIESAKVDWIVLPVITTDTTICIKAILSQTTVRTSTGC
jgi:hypothetical protein